MKIYNRKLKKYEESSQYGGGFLEFMYHHCLGRMLLKIVIHPVVSKIGGFIQNSALSKGRIKPFIEQNHINMSDYEDREYKSFNDFFTRKAKPGKRPVDMAKNSFVAPADSKLSIYPIKDGQMVTVKGVEYTLPEMVGRKVDLSSFEGGYCMVFRLSVDDYHRYSFVDDGRVTARYHLKGKLHTVSSISSEHKIYRENSRVVNVLRTKNFGKIIWIEVGALLVGKIKNHPVRTFTKGMEKGYFELGGSTILLLVEQGKIRLDEDVEQICKSGVEVKLQMGEKIGEKAC